MKKKKQQQQLPPMQCHNYIQIDAIESFNLNFTLPETFALKQRNDTSTLPQKNYTSLMF